MTQSGWKTADAQLECACGLAAIPWPSATGQATCQICGRIYRSRTIVEMLAVSCPCCGWSGDVFDPTPGGKPNQNCPTCKSKPRHRMIALYFRLRTNALSHSGTFLHFAPEPSLNTFLRSGDQLSVVTTDLKQRGVTVHTDITRMAIREETFDYALASHVLEHIPNDAAAFRELYRILKPGGSALIIVPFYWKRQTTYEDFSITDPAERETHFGQRDHVRKCGLDYGQRMIDAGFDLEPIVTGNTFSADQLQRHAIRPKDLIFHCHKPAR